MRDLLANDGAAPETVGAADPTPFRPSERGPSGQFSACMRILASLYSDCFVALYACLLWHWHVPLCRSANSAALVIHAALTTMYGLIGGFIDLRIAFRQVLDWGASRGQWRRFFGIPLLSLKKLLTEASSCTRPLQPSWTIASMQQRSGMDRFASGKWSANSG
jgi:hypothetical protein